MATHTTQTYNGGSVSVSGFELQQASHFMAIATKEQHGSLLREARRIRERMSTRLEGIQQYLRDFTERRLLTIQECERLSVICEMTMGGQEVGQEAVMRVRHIYYELIDTGAAPLAVAIAGVAVSSLELAVGHTSAASIGTSDVSGAIAGASAGSKVPNPYGPAGGAAAGAVVGGVGASLLAWWAP